MFLFVFYFAAQSLGARLVVLALLVAQIVQIVRMLQNRATGYILKLETVGAVRGVITSRDRDEVNALARRVAEAINNPPTTAKEFVVYGDLVQQTGNNNVATQVRWSPCRITRASTIIQQGDGNTANQINGSVGRVDDPVADHEAMTKFPHAAAGSLPALEASTLVARADAMRMLEAIGADVDDETPGRARRREMAAALRRIIEGAAGSVLAAGLLDNPATSAGSRHVDVHRPPPSGTGRDTAAPRRSPAPPTVGARARGSSG